MFDVALQGVRDTGGTALIMSGDRAEGQLLPKLYAEPMIAGRGRLARRGERPARMQVGHFEPVPDAAIAAGGPLPEADAAPLADETVSGRTDAEASIALEDDWPASEAASGAADDDTPSNGRVELTRRSRRSDAE